MKTGIPRFVMGLGVLLAPLAFGQRARPGEYGAPVYRVTVVERTVKAINYQYHSGPTQIDFRGTVLLPNSKGEATVESQAGRTEIDARLDGLNGPQRFGSEYLAYVLWAITPEGRPHNIGELIPDASGKARIRVTTDLQAFALIVTAEPYSAVRQPSDVVVAENQVRADTSGTIEPVNAKYELLPRGEYTWQVPSDFGRAIANTPKVSMREYEAQIERYQAQNAVGIARHANAERYAPEVLARARQLLADAQPSHDRRDDFRTVVEHAREAAQTAEDARAIAERRQQAEQLQAAHSEVSKAQAELSSIRRDQDRALQARDEALENVQLVQARADAARAQALAALAAREQAESEAALARQRAEHAPSQAQLSDGQAERDEQELAEVRKRESRQQLLDDLKRALPPLDTGRGLVATVPDDGFRGAFLRDTFEDQVARIARILCEHPDLRVSVEGYSDVAAKEPLTRDRAEAVRRVLVGNGVAANAVFAAGLGDSRPLGSNATPQGRTANSRVEIVIAGESIGRLPLWEQPTTFTLTKPRS